jgi:hypothetical protein
MVLPSLCLADSYGAPSAAPYNSYDSYSGRAGSSTVQLPPVFDKQLLIYDKKKTFFVLRSSTDFRTDSEFI